ncbi:hypothetical protein BGZ54_006014, partial [Gamsiella multidivaricata]
MLPKIADALDRPKSSEDASLSDAGRGSWTLASKKRIMDNWDIFHRGYQDLLGNPVPELSPSMKDFETANKLPPKTITRLIKMRPFINKMPTGSLDTRCYTKAHIREFYPVETILHQEIQ